MPVTFDEVVGRVEPGAINNPGGEQAGEKEKKPSELDAKALRAMIRRTEYIAERVRAT